MAFCYNYLRRYNKLGQLAEFFDSLSGITSTFDYDDIGRLTSTVTSDGSLDTDYRYDEKGRLDSKSYTGFGVSNTHSYNYTSDGYLQSVIFSDNMLSSVGVDKFGRLEDAVLVDTNADNELVRTTYTYANGMGGANATTTLVSNENTSGFGNFGYSYMPNGNIYWMTATRNGTSYDVSYEYDDLGQLTTEANFYTNQTVYYTYDAGGNITSKRTYDGVWWTLEEDSLVTDTYTYGNSEWKDLLTAYNGQTITYDTIGNPLTYRRGETMTWEGGRRLSEIYFDDYGDMLFFDYDSNGMRLRKYGPRVDDYNHAYVNDTLFYVDYYYDGDTLIYERRSGDGDNATERFTIEYAYGVNGITGFRIHQGNTTTDYYYVKNIMGDVLGIVDGTGTLVAEYHYDAYGKPVQILDGNGNDVSANYSHIANINPIRYRGYYYDIESGFYYLNSRYYDPEIGRFISADGYVSTGQDITGFNMFSYCGNNPVSRVDSTGDSWEDICKAVDNWCKSFKKKVEKVLKPYKRSNGYYAFYDSKSTSMTKKNKFREQFVAAEISTPSVDPTEGSVGLGSINADLHKGGWELGDVKISLLEFGHFEAAAEVSKAEALNFGFQASVWSPSVSFKVSDNIEVEIGLEILSIGGAYSFNSQDHEFKSNNFINFEIRWCE